MFDLERVHMHIFRCSKLLILVLQLPIRSLRRFMMFLALTEQKQRELGILNCGIRFEGITGSTALRKKIKDVACYAPEIGKELFDMMDRRLICGALIRAAWEQAPNEDNKITLAEHEKDIFGIPRPVLHYRKTNFDKNTVLKTIESIAYFGNQLPIFSGSGSNAIVDFDDNSKVGNLFLSSLYKRVISYLVKACLFLDVLVLNID